MKSDKFRPNAVEPSTLATLDFTKPGKEPSFSEGFVVRFQVAPKVGDLLRVEHQSIRRLKREELHQSGWVVVDVHHDLNLDDELAFQNEEQYPTASLVVTVHPAQ
jgi:hypothetical protein